MMLSVAGTIERETARISIESMELPLNIDEFLDKFNKYSNEAVAACPLMPGTFKHKYYTTLW